MLPAMSTDARCVCVCVYACVCVGWDRGREGGGQRESKSVSDSERESERKRDRCLIQPAHLIIGVSFTEEPVRLPPKTHDQLTHARTRVLRKPFRGGKLLHVSVCCHNLQHARKNYASERATVCTKKLCQ